MELFYGWLGGGQYPNEVDPELLKSVDCVKLVKVWRQPVKKVKDGHCHAFNVLLNYLDSLNAGI